VGKPGQAEAFTGKPTPMKALLILPVMALLLGAQPDPTPPQATIANGIVKATLYLPDAQRGYYRGSRFDWSGVVAALDYRGHGYFGEWNEQPYDPYLHDAITGPVEEFAAIGHDETKAGESFLKIGVGMLQRLDERPNHFTIRYPIANPGRWTVKPQADRVTFTHELTDASGYGYRYQKVVRLTKGKPELVLEHRLENTGKRPLTTTVYNHNFFVLDQQPTGPDFTVTFPFTPQPDGPLDAKAALNGKQLTLTRPFKRGEGMYTLLTGYGTGADAYAIRVENRRTGAAVQVRGDRPLAKLAFWANPANLSPEPYIGIDLQPGKVFTWKLTYTFSGPGRGQAER